MPEDLGYTGVLMRQQQSWGSLWTLIIDGRGDLYRWHKGQPIPRGCYKVTRLRPPIGCTASVYTRDGDLLREYWGAPVWRD